MSDTSFDPALMKLSDGWARWNAAVADAIATVADRDKIAAATAALQAARQAEKTAAEAAKQAKQATAAAERKAAEVAKAGGDVLAAETALEDASRAVRVADRIAAGAVARVAEAEQGLKDATRQAFEPAMREAIKRRIAALKEAADLVEKLRQAYTDFRFANAMLAQAANSGGMHPPSLPAYNHLIDDTKLPAIDLEYELQVLRGNNIDPETGRIWWMS